MKTRSMKTRVLPNDAARAESGSAYHSAPPFNSMDRTQLISAVQVRSTPASDGSADESLHIALDRWENDGGRVWTPELAAAACTCIWSKNDAS